MGLDMHLTKKTYVKNWSHTKHQNIYKIRITKNDKKVTSIKKTRISYIVEDVMYWRKANQIHTWFVDKIQNGNDDCNEYLVSREQLEILLLLITKTLKTPTKAKDFLPAHTGFFFGNESYDKYYFKNLKETKITLEKLIKEKNGDFYYQSSW